MNRQSIRLMLSIVVILLPALTVPMTGANAAEGAQSGRQTVNFNRDWRFAKGEQAEQADDEQRLAEIQDSSPTRTVNLRRLIHY